jgi:hypothetical protein
MSFHPPSIDTTHGMYQPGRGAKTENCGLYRTSAVIPDPNGSHEQRQAWMREKQEAKRRPVFAVTAAVKLADPVPFPRRKRHANSIITVLAHQYAAALQQRLCKEGRLKPWPPTRTK